MEEHFRDENLEQNGVFLTGDEEDQLISVLQSLIDVQIKNSDPLDNGQYTPAMAMELAGLTFVAGRSYQKDQDGDKTDAVDYVDAWNEPDSFEEEALNTQRQITQLCIRLLQERL